MTKQRSATTLVRATTVEVEGLKEKSAQTGVPMRELADRSFRLLRASETFLGALERDFPMEWGDPEDDVLWRRHLSEFRDAIRDAGLPGM